MVRLSFITEVSFKLSLHSGLGELLGKVREELVLAGEVFAFTQLFKGGLPCRSFLICQVSSLFA